MYGLESRSHSQDKLAAQVSGSKNYKFLSSSVPPSTDKKKRFAQLLANYYPKELEK